MIDRNYDGNIYKLNLSFSHDKTEFYSTYLVYFLENLDLTQWLRKNYFSQLLIPLRYFFLKKSSLGLHFFITNRKILLSLECSYFFYNSKLKYLFCFYFCNLAGFFSRIIRILYEWKSKSKTFLSKTLMKIVSNFRNFQNSPSVMISKN